MNAKRKSFLDRVKIHFSDDMIENDDIVEVEPYLIKIRPVEEMPERLKKTLRIAYKESFSDKDLEK